MGGCSPFRLPIIGAGGNILPLLIAFFALGLAGPTFAQAPPPPPPEMAAPSETPAPQTHAEIHVDHANEEIGRAHV